ncbi:MAG TPA: carboxypeptidase regulatory-like domain-containing protein [Vicinamibacterales bacterium]
MPAPAAPAAGKGRIEGRAAAGAIVMLEPKTPHEFPPPETAAMDQVSRTFSPPLLIVRTGAAVEFWNSDDTLHNVHVGNTDTGEPAFNVAIPTGEVYRYTFTKNGLYHVACDVHPEMTADIVSVSTPFAVQTGPDGAFVFDDVPPGSYVVRVIAGGRTSERDADVVSGSNNVRVP